MLFIFLPCLPRLPCLPCLRRAQALRAKKRAPPPPPLHGDSKPVRLRQCSQMLSNVSKCFQMLSECSPMLVECPQMFPKARNCSQKLDLGPPNGRLGVSGPEVPPNRPESTIRRVLPGLPANLRFRTSKRAVGRIRPRTAPKSSRIDNSEALSGPACKLAIGAA